MAIKRNDHHLGIGLQPQDSELPKAHVVDAIPGHPGGLIPTEFLYKPIKIELRSIWRFPAQAGETDYVHFFIKPHTPEGEYPLPAIALEGPLTQEKDFPVELSIGGNWLNFSGSYDLRYEVRGPGGIEISPFTTTFTLDWVPPGGNRPLELLTFVDPDIDEHGITEDYLAAHSEIELLIPDFLDRQPFDDVLIFLLSSESSNPFLSTHTQTFETTTEPLIVRVPSELFRLLEAGKRFVRYTLRDLAGNHRPTYSGPTPVKIDLDPLPSGLQPPWVVAYELNNVVDRAGARDGVTVRIRAYFDWKPSDEVVVSWNGIVLARDTVEVLPKDVSVNWPELIQKGYVQSNFPVQYFIFRAGSSDGTPSPIRYIDADFRVAGQDHDQAPAEYNRHLERLEIRGGGSASPNHLDYNDVDKPVTATVALFDNPKVGEWMDLYWGDKELPIASYHVKAGDVAGQNVTFTSIAWSVIADTPNNPALAVTYRTSNGVNTQLAPDRLVNINIVKPVLFPRAECPWADNGWLNCLTKPPIWEGVYVRIYKDDNILIGDEIRMKWQGSAGFGGHEPFPETAEVFMQAWTIQDQEVGYKDFIVPYIPYVKPMKTDAGGSAEYTVWRGGGRVGHAPVRYLKIDRTYSHNPVFYCGPDGNGPE